MCGVLELFLPALVSFSLRLIKIKKEKLYIYSVRRDYLNKDEKTNNFEEFRSESISEVKITLVASNQVKRV